MLTESLDKIAIVGGGVAGLAVAAFLARSGFNIDLHERGDSIRAYGAGIQVSPNGGAALNALGIRNIGGIASKVQLYAGETSTYLTTIHLSKAPGLPEYQLVHRGDLIEALHQAAVEAGAIIHPQSNIVSVDPGDQSTLASLEASNGTVIHADLVIAADGVGSKAREHLALMPPKFKGMIAWRALIEDEPQDLKQQAEIWTGAGRHIVSYPLIKRGMRNIVAIEENRHIPKEEGWHHQGNPDELGARFSDFHARPKKWLSRVTQTGIWGLYDHDVPRCWSRERLVLIGDAAHPTLPFMAQGANLALEDAAILARLLIGGKSHHDLAKLRYQRVTKTIETARRNAKLYHMPRSIKRFSAHLALRAGGEIAGKILSKRFSWIYDFDPMKQPLSK